MSLALQLYRAYWAVEQRLAPGLRYSQSEYEDALERAVHSGCRWLDIGCGATVLPPWRGTQEATLLARPGLLVGADVDFSSLRRNRSVKSLVCGDGSRLPFADETFDLVTANMVVEHLPDPVMQFREVARVLRSGGRFLFHTPNLHNYGTYLARATPEFVKSLSLRVLEGRNEEDRFKAYYRANSFEQVPEIARQAGLTVASMSAICNSAIFARVLPLAILELLWIRALQSPRLERYRPNLIVVLARP